MKKNKPSTLRRITGYIIDLFVVMLLTEIMSKMFLNLETYYQKNNDLVDLVRKTTSGEITQEEYTKEYDVLHYELSKASVKVNAISCVIIVVYYVVLCYFCHGMTLGKYMMKLQIVSNNGKELTIFHYLSRSLIINMLLSNVMSVVLIKTLSQGQFLKFDTYVQNGISIAIIISFLLIMYRNDGRGIQDFMGNTKVIDLKNSKEKEVPEEEKPQIEEEKKVKEAKVVKETKERKKKKDVK